MKSRIALLIAVNLMTISAQAQSEIAAFNLTGLAAATPFARDYQSLGINPANLNIKSAYEKTLSMGLFDMTFSIHSDALSKTDLRANVFGGQLSTLSQSQKREYALSFATGSNAVNSDMMTFGISKRTEKMGTFAFSIRDRFSYKSKLGQTASDILWLGFNAPYFDSLVVQNGAGLDTILNSQNINPDNLNIISGFVNSANALSISKIFLGTRMNLTWYREFNLGWGTTLLDREGLQLHLGGAAKFLWGQGLIDITDDGTNTQAYSSLSPIISIDYGAAASANPTALSADAWKFKPVGTGFGVDLGAAMVIQNRITLNASILDIGQINWTGNVYELDNQPLLNYQTTGLENPDIINCFDLLQGSDGFLTWKGSFSKRTTLPTTLRLGAGFDDLKWIKFGADVIAPVGQNYAAIDKAMINVGGEITIAKWLHFQAGYSKGGNYGAKIPVGFYVSRMDGAKEFGIASRDAITFFRDNDPTLSFAMGFMRFRW